MPVSHRRAVAHVGHALYVSMLVTLAVFLLLLSVDVSPGVALVRDYGVGNLVYLLPALLLVCRGILEPDHRAWSLLLAGAVVSFLLGNVLFLYLDATGGVPFPSVADVGYLGIYPLYLAAIATAVRSGLQGARLAVFLDAAIGAATVATVGSLAIAPLIGVLWDGSVAAVISLAYPLGDLVVVSAALGALGIQGRRGRLFWSWAIGVVVYCVADTVYAYRQAFGTYEVGTLLDGLWALGFVIAAGIAWRVTPRRGEHVPGTASLVVTGVGVLAAGIVLAVSPDLAARPGPSVLGLLTLTLCVARVFVAFLQLHRLSTLQQQVLTDDLTGVGNRRGLNQRLDALLASAKDGTGSSDEHPTIALLIADLDRFKEVNDSYGHAAGDTLLQDVSDRFVRTLADEPDSVIARLGGDEFAIVLCVPSKERARELARQLLASLDEPFQVDDVTLHVNVSIGLAWATDDAGSRSDLMFSADVAMYAAKQAGEGLKEACDVETGDRRNRRQVAEDLHSALERDELVTAYQPILDRDDKVVAYEALVRWNHPQRGMLLPGEFLAVAEEHHLSHRITGRVADLALQDLAGWRSVDPDVRVSVNVSAVELDQRLVDTIQRLLARYALPADCLIIEVTENAMMRNPSAAQEVFTALKRIGVRLAIDDYGRGHSSLEYLLRLPLDILKLDRIFVAETSDNPRAAEIVRSTVQLSHALGLHMVAEGIEDAEAHRLLVELGCDHFQGFHLGRPAPASALACAS